MVTTRPNDLFAQLAHYLNAAKHQLIGGDYYLLPFIRQRNCRVSNPQWHAPKKTSGLFRNLAEDNWKAKEFPP